MELIFLANVTAALILLGASGAAVAHLKTYRIGWLGDGSPPAGASQSSGGFQQGLRDIGYVDGRNVAIEYPTLPAT